MYCVNITIVFEYYASTLIVIISRSNKFCLTGSITEVIDIFIKIGIATSGMPAVSACSNREDLNLLELCPKMVVKKFS